MAQGRVTLSPSTGYTRVIEDYVESTIKPLMANGDQKALNEALSSCRYQCLGVFYRQMRIQRDALANHAKPF